MSEHKKLLIGRQHLAHAGVFDEHGRELTHAHVMAHYQDLLGEPLMALAKHAHALKDQTDHAIHQDLAEAAHGRMSGVWQVDKFDAPIEYYAYRLLHTVGAHQHVSDKDMHDLDFHALPEHIRIAADAALKRNHRANTDRFEERASDFENLFLTVGVTALWQVAIGNASVANTSGAAAGVYALLNNAQARVAVGDSTTAASAAQTGLQAPTNVYYVGMDATYPTQSTNQTVFRATFTGTVANYSWQEFCVDNCNGSNSTATTKSGGSSLDRVVSNQGTKASGQTWQPSLTLSIS